MNVPVNTLDELSGKLAVIAKQVAAAQALLNSLQTPVAGDYVDDARGRDESNSATTIDTTQAVNRIAPSEASGPFENTTEGAKSPVRGLAPRHIELLRLMSKGLTDAEAADDMGIKLTTIRQIKQTIYRRLGVHNVLAALNAARELGLVDAPTGSQHEPEDSPVDCEQPNTLPATTELVHQEKLYILYSRKTGKFVSVNLPEAQGTEQAIACFSSDESAHLFARYNQAAANSIIVDMDAADAQDIAKNQDSTSSGFLVLLDEPANPVVINVAVFTD